MNRPGEVSIVEVGPRDGLQNEPEPIATADKIRFIGLLTDAGLRRIEVTSFVHPKWVPQLADAQEVCRQLRVREGVVYSALVPNQKGMDAARGVGVQAIAVFTAASESFNQKNINCSIGESIERFRPVMEQARAANIPVRGYVSTCFVCPYEGRIAPTAVLRVCERLLQLGCAELSIGDTIGAATPNDVTALLDLVIPSVTAEKIALHFHNTRGTALANVLVGLERGIHIFDASAGGLGGCPYAPGASGNLATEDLVYMLEGMGVRTGIHLDRLLAASRFIQDVLGRALPAAVLRAGGAPVPKGAVT